MNNSALSSAASSGLFDDIVSPLNAVEETSRAVPKGKRQESVGDSIFDSVKTQESSADTSLFDEVLTAENLRRPVQALPEETSPSGDFASSKR